MTWAHIRNRGSLLAMGNRGERRLILDCIDAGLRSVDPANLLKENLGMRSNTLLLKGRTERFDLREYDDIFVVGGGKASGAMAKALEEVLPGLISEGCVNVLKGTKRRFHTKRIRLNEASHPVPDQAGVRGTEEMVKILRRSSEKSLVICLISGGGSSLLPLPARGVTLEDIVSTTDLLLRSGANIDLMNCVRKHLSAVKGGQLVRYADGATILALIISDVVGDHLDSIASGPTVPDHTTFSHSLKILKQLRILAEVPSNVRARIEAGSKGLLQDTPKANDPVFSRVSNVLIGSNRIACERILAALEKQRAFRPLDVKYIGSSVTGEASNVAKKLVSRASRLAKPSPGSVYALVWGGETTVTVRGNGVGGRNQEEALSALYSIGKGYRSDLTFAFFGTDGIDGRTGAAGAMVDIATFEKARELGLSITDHLERNDSNTFFKLVRNSLIITGATGTNVNDIGIAIISKRDRKKSKARFGHLLPHAHF